MRYDQLMSLGWVVFFEAALLNVFLAALLIARKDIGNTNFGIGLGLLVAATIALFIIAKNANAPQRKITTI